MATADIVNGIVDELNNSNPKCHLFVNDVSAITVSSPSDFTKPTDPDYKSQNVYFAGQSQAQADSLFVTLRDFLLFAKSKYHPNRLHYGWFVTIEDNGVEKLFAYKQYDQPYAIPANKTHLVVDIDVSFTTFLD